MKKLLCLILPFLLLACSNKLSVSKSPVDVDASILISYDSLINTTLEEIKTDSTSDVLKDKILKLTEALSICERDGTLYYGLLQQKPVTIIDKSKTKIRNSNNTKVKDSNNQVEVTKLKNALQIKDSKLDSVNFDNLALKGRIRDLDKDINKNKNSTTGDNSPNTNTSSKSPWYVWLIVFCAGGITSIGIRSAITKTI